MPPGDSTTDHSSRENHPVWAVYDERRTARLNIKCLNAEIKSLQTKNKLVEGTIALSGASSIGGFWFLQNVPGLYAWKTLGAVAVVLTVLKPILSLADRRAKKERLLASYQILEHDLYCVTLGVQERKSYDDQAIKEFHSALARKREILGQADGSNASPRTIKRCQDEVNRELPSSQFYIPPDN